MVAPVEQVVEVECIYYELTPGIHEMQRVFPKFCGVPEVDDVVDGWVVVDVKRRGVRFLGREILHVYVRRGGKS